MPSQPLGSECDWVTHIHGDRLTRRRGECYTEIQRHTPTGVALPPPPLQPSPPLRHGMWACFSRCTGMGSVHTHTGTHMHVHAHAHFHTSDHAEGVQALIPTNLTPAPAYPCHTQPFQSMVDPSGGWTLLRRPPWGVWPPHWPGRRPRPRPGGTGRGGLSSSDSSLSDSREAPGEDL